MLKRLAVGVILVLIVAAAGWMGSKVAKEWSRIGVIDGEIRTQEDAVQAAREEAKKLRAQVEQARSEVAAAADSLGADPTALVMNRSFEIAKVEATVEQDRLRAQRRLRYLGDERATATNSLKRWGATLAAVEAFLIGGLIVVWRYGARRG